MLLGSLMKRINRALSKIAMRIKFIVDKALSRLRGSINIEKHLSDEKLKKALLARFHAHSKLTSKNLTAEELRSTQMQKSLAHEQVMREMETLKKLDSIALQGGVANPEELHEKLDCLHNMDIEQAIEDIQDEQQLEQIMQCVNRAKKRISKRAKYQKEQMALIIEEFLQNHHKEEIEKRKKEEKTEEHEDLMRPVLVPSESLYESEEEKEYEENIDNDSE